MSDRRGSFLPVLLLLAIPVGALATPLFLSDTTPPHLAIDRFVDLPPAERVVACRQQLVETNTSLDALDLRLRDEESELHAARADLAEVPLQINELTSALPEMLRNVKSLEASLAAVESDLAAYRATIASMLAAVRQRASVELETELKTVYERIESELAERNEKRARLGAMPAGQDEILHTRKQRKRAEGIAAVNYQIKVDRKQNEIDLTIADLDSEVANVTLALTTTRGRLVEAQEALDSAKHRFLALPSEIALLEAQVERDQVEVARLQQLRMAQEQVFDLAQADLQRHHEELAREQRRVRERQLAAVQSTSTTPASRSSYVRPGSTSRSTRYYDPTYRPPVGDHHVSSYVKRDGTFIRSHRRTDPDDSFYNNWTSKGNVNPYTGRRGTRWK